MKYIYSILFVSASFISFGQNIQKDEIKRATILENPENYLREGGVLTDELLKNKLPDKTPRTEPTESDFIIHFEMKTSNDKGLGEIRNVGGDYDNSKSKWILQNKELYDSMQNIILEKPLTPEERMNHYQK